MVQRLELPASMPPAPPYPRRWSDVRSPSYITYRRHLLDAYLAWARPLMSGVVVDLGGKQEGKRGVFRPPTDGVRWVYVNIAAHTRPSVFADVTEVPLRDGSADCVICTEVLEHLPNPDACISETYRVLRRGGLLIGSTPFVYPFHADPHDFQRFTSQGIRRLLGCFDAVRIDPMGGYFGALGLLVELGLHQLDRRTLWRRVTARAASMTAAGLVWMDLRAASRNGTLSDFANGFFFIARK